MEKHDLFLTKIEKYYTLVVFLYSISKLECSSNKLISFEKTKNYLVYSWYQYIAPKTTINMLDCCLSTTNIVK